MDGLLVQMRNQQAFQPLETSIMRRVWMELASGDASFRTRFAML